MISTFDLTLMGALISLGGLLFFLVGNRRRATSHLSACGNDMHEEHAQLGDGRERAEFLAGMRWLTVGILVLFVGFTRGNASGYLFDLWTDVAFHVGILSACWAATAYRVKHVAGAGRPALRSSSSLPAPPASNGLNTAG